MSAPVLGQAVPRKDGIKKVTGAATYTSDIVRPKLAYASLVRSTIASGKITHLDASRALAAPGVIAVITPDNAIRLHPPGSMATGGEFAEKFFPVQDSEIHYWGQYVAVVIAETLEQAEEATGLVHVEYSVDDLVIDLHRDSPEVHQPLLYMALEKAQIHRGDYEKAVAAAPLTVTAVYTTPYLHHNAMEPHATVAEWKGGELTVHEPTQWVMGLRSVVAKSFDLKPESVRVLSPFVGGGFGSKGFSWPHTILAAMAAKLTGRPVKLVLTRAEMFTSVGHRGLTEQEIVLAADRDGKLTAIKHATLTQTSIKGSHFESAGLATNILYACPNAEITHRVARLNTGSPTPMRAPGEAPGTFALESAMDELAYKLDLDPIELRIRNHADEDPSKQQPWSSKHLLECYRRGAELFGWSQRNPVPKSMTDGAELVGLGFATATYPANRRKSKAAVRAYPDGKVVVRAATQDIGTGTYTTLAQVAADELGVSVAQVTCEIGDSTLPPGGVSGGSSTSASMGPAVREAAQNLLKLCKGAPVAEAAHVSGKPFLEAEGEGGSSADKSGVSTHSFGAQFVEVRIDPLTRRIRVARVVTVIDAGKIMNAMTARSQIQGGVVWGIGMALLEKTEFDLRNASPVTRNLADYLVPVNADIPDLTVEFVEHPDYAFNSLGVRGIGEIGITGITAAIANAIYHATGVRVRDLPITLDRLLT